MPITATRALSRAFHIRMSIAGRTHMERNRRESFLFIALSTVIALATLVGMLINFLGINPIDALTGLSRAISSQDMTPGLRCGRSPVASSTAIEAARIAPAEVLGAALASAGIDPARRGETLSVEEWEALDRALGPSPDPE